MAETEQSDVMSLTVTLLSAYFVNNTVPSGELPALVEGTRKALLGGSLPVPASAEVRADPARPEAAASEPASPEPVGTGSEFKPAVTVEESLASPDHIVSMIDGKPYKALKRHLGAHGLTFAEYRARYSLPSDYPKVAPGYSAARREVAMRMGLGGKRKGVAAASLPASEVAPVTEVAPAPEPVTEGVAAIPAEPAAAVAAAEKPARARRARTNVVPAEAPPEKPKARTKATRTKATAADAPDTKKGRKPRAAKTSPKPQQDGVEAAPVAE